MALLAVFLLKYIYPCAFLHSFLAMADLSYEYMIVPAGTAHADGPFPIDSHPQWRPLPPKQRQRIEQNDFAVIYITQNGACYPFKVKENTADKSRFVFERRGSMDMVVKVMSAGSIVTCMHIL